MPRKRREEGHRAPNGASSVYYSEYDGKWHGRVTMGVRDNGKPDRRHVKRATEAKAARAVQELEQMRASGLVTKPGRSWTVEKWLRHWVETVALPTVRPTTAAGYRSVVYRHLIPGLGAHRLDRLQPEHIEKLYAKMLRQGQAAGNIQAVHRVMRRALNVAVARGHIARSPAQTAKAPRVEEDEVVPFSVEEAQRILAITAGRRNGTRFALALALGLRKGEALGLKWSRVDLAAGILRPSRQLQRYRWEHGCGDPHACGRNRHRQRPCPDGCKRHHRKPCPPPCQPDCTAHAASCPMRRGGGLVDVDVKSRAGRRVIGIPAPLLALLRAHQDAQVAEQKAAGSEWRDGGWVFTQPNGKPIDPRADHAEWKAVLAAAGVRDARLHDARHTAATMLLVLGVPARAVMEVMGWSQVAMTARYQHIPSSLVTSIADQMGGLLWKAD